MMEPHIPHAPACRPYSTKQPVSPRDPLRGQTCIRVLCRLCRRHWCSYSRRCPHCSVKLILPPQKRRSRIMLEDEIEEDEDGTSGGEFVEGVFEGEVGEGAAGEVFEEGATPMLAPPLVRCRSSVIPKTDIEKSTESSLLQYL